MTMEDMVDREFDPQEAEFIANIVKHHNTDRGQHSFDRGQSKDVAPKSAYTLPYMASVIARMISNIVGCSPTIRQM